MSAPVSPADLGLKKLFQSASGAQPMRWEATHPPPAPAATHQPPAPAATHQPPAPAARRVFVLPESASPAPAATARPSGGSLWELEQLRRMVKKKGEHTLAAPLKLSQKTSIKRRPTPVSTTPNGLSQALQAARRADRDSRECLAQAVELLARLHTLEEKRIVAHQFYRAYQKAEAHRLADANESTEGLYAKQDAAHEKRKLELQKKEAELEAKRKRRQEDEDELKED